MTRVPLGRAPVTRFEISSGVRCVWVICPWCGREHRHAYPLGTLSSAQSVRTPRCSGKRPDYTLILPSSPDEVPSVAAPVATNTYGQEAQS